MHPESERERRALIDRLTAILAIVGDEHEDDVEITVEIGVLEQLLAALRQPTAEPDEIKGLRLELRDALEGQRRWMLRCGYTYETPLRSVPADTGRLAYDTMRTGSVSGTSRPLPEDRWESLPHDVRQRWAWVECACIDRARATAEPDTAGREAGAADMRERAAREAEEECWALSEKLPDAPRTVVPYDRSGAEIAAAIRSLPLHPEGSERTMGGDRP